MLSAGDALLLEGGGYVDQADPTGDELAGLQSCAPSMGLKPAK